MARAPVPRGQVAIPPEISEYMKDAYQLKGGITAFSKQSGIKSDTLRLAMKRGTTTAKTLDRLRVAVEKAGVPVLMPASRALVTRPPSTNGNGEAPAPLDHVQHLPPAVLRQVQRVSSALLDGMQLMQLTILKAIQEEMMDGAAAGPARARS